MSYNKTIENIQDAIGDIASEPIIGNILGADLNKLSAGVNMVAPLVSGDISETLTGLGAVLNELNLENVLEIGAALGINNIGDIINENGLENLEGVLVSLGVADTFEKFAKDNLFSLLGMNEMDWVINTIPNINGIFDLVSIPEIVSILGESTLPTLPDINSVLVAIDTLSDSDITSLASNIGSLLSNISTAAIFPADILEDVSSLLEVVDIIDTASTLIGVTTDITNYSSKIVDLTGNISGLRSVINEGNLDSLLSSVDTISKTIPSAFDDITNFQTKATSIVGAFDIVSAMDNVKDNMGSFIFPVSSGTLSSSFGEKFNPFTGEMDLFNKGIDIEAAFGEAVNNVAKGIVTYVGDLGCYGNTVIIKHADNMFSKFSLLGDIHVEIGDTVAANVSIGTVGSVDTPHVRYELRTSDIPDDNIPAIDPTVLFKNLPGNVFESLQNASTALSSVSSIVEAAKVIGSVSEAKNALSGTLSDIVENPLGILSSEKEVIVWNT